MAGVGVSRGEKCLRPAKKKGGEPIKGGEKFRGADWIRENKIIQKPDLPANVLASPFRRAKKNEAKKIHLIPEVNQVFLGGKRGYGNSLEAFLSRRRWKKIQGEKVVGKKRNMQCWLDRAANNVKQ